jgi:hypothetical protein
MRDRGAVGLGDEEGAVGGDRRGEADDRRRFLLGLPAAAPGRLRISRSISLRMIAGIIWKVEALPTPVAKNSTMNIAKKPQKARLVLDADEVEHAAHRRDHQHEGPEGDPPAAVAVGEPAGAGERERADQRPRKANCSALTSGNCVLAAAGSPPSSR